MPDPISRRESLACGGEPEESRVPNAKSAALPMAASLPLDGGTSRAPVRNQESIPWGTTDYSGLFGASASPERGTASTANSNAQRTTERAGIAPYAAAGAMGDQYGLFAGAAALKGREQGVEVEVASVSVQGGLQTEVQAGLLRLGYSSDDGQASVTGEALTAKAGFGFENPDGSRGFNLGMMATAVSVEGTFPYTDPWTGGDRWADLGASLSLGFEASGGFRDIDHDGRPEACVRISLGPVTAGLCEEL